MVKTIIACTDSIYLLLKAFKNLSSDTIYLNTRRPLILFFVPRWILTPYLVVIWAANGIRAKKSSDPMVPQVVSSKGSMTSHENRETAVSLRLIELLACNFKLLLFILKKRHKML
jgi:hypothetical protein